MSQIDTTKVLSEAILISCQGHYGQYDKGGNPYILHPMQVMRSLQFLGDFEVMAMAILHDVIEDTDMTYEELRKRGMTERVIDGVRRLTKVPGESQDEYLEKVKGSRDSIMVKMADLRHNSDLTRMRGVSEKDFKRVAKYMRMYDELEMALGEKLPLGIV